MKKINPYLYTYFLLLFSCTSEQQILWQIGISDNRVTEFALSPDSFQSFLKHDFGWEDRFFLIGYSKAKEDFPYVLPGPDDTWGGTWSTAGWRSHVLNIFFELSTEPPTGEWELFIDLLDTDDKKPPLLKVIVNEQAWTFPLQSGQGDTSLKGSTDSAQEQIIRIPLKASWLRQGGNEIRLTTLRGSWLIFDALALKAPSKAALRQPQEIFIRSVRAADYSIAMLDRKAAQPLLVDVEHLRGEATLTVELDGEEIFSSQLERGRYVFEAPMPTVEKPQESLYSVRVNGSQVARGSIVRSYQRPITYADYVNPFMGAAHSRWMIAPGAWAPFSMVKLSPDNQNGGWQAGYDPIFESIGGFSHIHEWTMSGLSLMPTNGKLTIKEGDQDHPDSGYRSRMDKSREEGKVGYYKAYLSDYGILAELTSTTRCGFHRYTFPNKDGTRILIDLQTPAEYDYQLDEILFRQVNKHQIEGFSRQTAPHVWGNIKQEYTIHFVIDFDQPIRKVGVWKDDTILYRNSLQAMNLQDAGMFVEFDDKENHVIQSRVGISLVSIQGARENLQQEIISPWNWDFQAVRDHHVKEWNDILNRIEVVSDDRREKVRFYTNLYRSFCRNTWSDRDGSWVDANEQVRKLKESDAVALGCDAFWNTFWNLNQLWNLIAPEWSSRWVRSQLAMYDANGWLAKGPAGMEYIPVMVAEHEIPLIVGAYQMGIRDFDAEKAFKAVKKMQTTPPQKVGGGLAGNRDLVAYLKHQYVPYDKGRFSNTLEYAFDDWAVSQFAKALGKEQDYLTFSQRAGWWKNVIDTVTGYARMRDSKRNWLEPFDAYKSGANDHYVEGNAWQLTFFVPQDIEGLVRQIGKERFVERLLWGFEASEPLRYNAPRDQYWDYPVVHGNQQSMHFAFLFNHVGKPWLTQRWSRSIMEHYYGYDISNAYLGDEDQGQMSAWFIMAAIGLFQIDGGVGVEPRYELGSPLFKKIILHLGNRYGRGRRFTIKANNTSRKNQYIQSATLNGKPLSNWSFSAKELLRGGELVLEMGLHPSSDK